MPKWEMMKFHGESEDEEQKLLYLDQLCPYYQKVVDGFREKTTSTIQQIFYWLFLKAQRSKVLCSSNHRWQGRPFYGTQDIR